jgi:dihydrofolate reductase
VPRVIFFTATTLNGFLADDDDSLSWLFAVGDPESSGMDRFLDSIGVLVMGSTTYEWVVNYEQLVEHPDKWTSYYGNRPTFVFSSRTLPQLPGTDIRFVSGEVVEHWHAIAEAAGSRDVWVVGGGDLVGQFDDAGHLDELQVSVAPVTLASGKPLLPRRIESDRLHLVSVAQAGQFAELKYAVSRPEA